jgi:uncharacterized protein YggL (DUF469 family)
VSAPNKEKLAMVNDKREIVISEFQNFINWLHEKNAYLHDGTRFGFRDISGEFAQQRIRALEDEFIEYLKEKGFYDER